MSDSITFYDNNDVTISVGGQPFIGLGHCADVRAMSWYSSGVEAVHDVNAAQLRAIAEAAIAAADELDRRNTP